jgi:hypothetical protein
MGTHHRRAGIGLLSLASVVGLAASANAAVVSVSRVITNTRNTAQTYAFEASITSSENIATAGIFGSFSVVISDFNRNGVMAASTAAGDLYSGWLGSTRVKSFVPSSSGGPAGSFQLSAAANQQNFFSAAFGTETAPEVLASSVNIGDQIRVRFEFVLSAGDQAAISGNFNVVDMSAVPGPGAAALLGLAGGLRGRNRRRTEND